MAPLQTAKRSACDRCRLQKLRCPPSADGTEACTRCTRLGAQCITSYPRPSNNAPQAVTHSQGLPELRPKATNGLPSPASMRSTPQRMPKSNPITSAPINHPVAHSSTNSVASLSLQYEPLMFSCDDNFDYFSDEASSLHLDTTDLLNTDPTTGLFADDIRTFPSPAPSGLEGRSGSLGPLDIPMDCDVDTASSGSARSNQQSDQHITYHNNIIKYDTRLSNLLLTLSKRLEQCLCSAAEGTTKIGNGRTEINSNDNGIAGLDGLNCTFENALGDLSEFLAIIQGYSTKRHGSSSDSTSEDLSNQYFRSRSNTGPTHRISLIAFLNLISAYLQIIVIYDKILNSLSAKLFGASAESTSRHLGSRTPDLFGGAPLRGNLQTKILIHAILHQFDVVERMLGLPAELRVTDKQGVYLGLFEDDRARGLLGAVSNGNRIENGWGPGQINVDDHRSSRALFSLRETLKTVQQFLDS